MLTAGYSACSLPRRDARRDLVQIAERLKEQNAQDAHGGALDHGGLLRKKRGEHAAEADNHKNRDRTAHRGHPEAQPQDAPAPVLLPRGIVLAGECGRRLSERRDDVVGEVFKVHDDGASGDHSLAEVIDRRLHKNVCKAEYCALHSGWDTGLQNFFRDFCRELRFAECKAKQRVFFEPPQHHHR